MSIGRVGNSELWAARSPAGCWQPLQSWTLHPNSQQSQELTSARLDFIRSLNVGLLDSVTSTLASEGLSLADKPPFYLIDLKKAYDFSSR